MNFIPQLMLICMELCFVYTHTNTHTHTNAQMIKIIVAVNCSHIVQHSQLNNILCVYVHAQKWTRLGRACICLSLTLSTMINVTTFWWIKVKSKLQNQFWWHHFAQNTTWMFSYMIDLNMFSYMIDLNDMRKQYIWAYHEPIWYRLSSHGIQTELSHQQLNFEWNV